MYKSAEFYWTERRKMDYLKLYNLETYLFKDVSDFFQKNKYLTAFDFFCIIIWKANRAKSKVAKRLLSKEPLGNNLDDLVCKLTKTIFNAFDDKERMRILIEDWKFQLPMASAVLTVLYPNEFTVYDVRVCDILKAHHKIKNTTKFKVLWDGYTQYTIAVKEKEPKIKNLRDKDRMIWAKSFKEQLDKDIKCQFKTKCDPQNSEEKE
jgi:hypothetical protein